ncbi:serine/threonine-protein kinase 4-like [Mastacembelus armatus]|nr:serine/threonine-protein kinase 4-like [Mastacembelus armatus]
MLIVFFTGVGFCSWEIKMGKEQSTLAKNGYIIEKENGNFAVATKGDDKFLIRRIMTDQIPRNSALITNAEILRTTSHSHIVSSKNSFEDENIYYVVTEYCHGGSLAAKIIKGSEPPQESEVLSLFVEMCMALRAIHQRGLLQKDLTPADVFLTEFGTVRLGGFQKLLERSENPPTTNSDMVETSYKAPEVFTQGTNDVKSDIWSLGCILYELCTQQATFSAESTIKLMPKILGGSHPSLPERFSPELHDLLNDIFSKDPQSRPTASEILEHPFIIRCLSEKSKTTLEDLQIKLTTLRELADSLERVHQGATIGSLAGGVIGAVGGVTSIVGLILSPFTLGASLVVTGVGVGVSVLGGVTAGASNITNMVNQSSDRKAVRSIIKEFEEKISAVVTWLQEISNSLQTIRNRYDSVNTPDTGESRINNSNLARLGLRAGKGLSATAELVRLIQAVNIGKIAAQGSRAVRLAEAATGVFSALFLAVDIFFIAMDAKEIHHIRQAKAVEEDAASKPVSNAETDDSVTTFDRAALVLNETKCAENELEHDTSEAQDQSATNNTPVRSEIMRFVQSIRQAADNLERVLAELENITSCVSLCEDVRELEWQDMEFMLC